jgi:hypothetical protein
VASLVMVFYFMDDFLQTSETPHTVRGCITPQILASFAKTPEKNIGGFSNLK